MVRNHLQSFKLEFSRINEKIFSISDVPQRSALRKVIEKHLSMEI
jgi:hypothetical protein